MLVRSIRRVLAPTSRSAFSTRSATPSLVRTLASSTPASNSEDGPRRKSQTYSHFSKLEYMLSERTISQRRIAEGISDDELHYLPLVIEAGGVWRPSSQAFPLPRRAGRGTAEDGDLPAYKLGEYVYNVFPLPADPHLKRFNQEVAKVFADWEGKTTSPVLLLDSKSCTLTVGIPSHIGLQPPFPAKDNWMLVRDLLVEYRDNTTSAERKGEIAARLRTMVIPNGLRRTPHQVAMRLAKIYSAVRQLSIEDVLKRVPLTGTRSGVEESVPVDIGSSSTRIIAEDASKTWSSERKKKPHPGRTRDPVEKARRAALPPKEPKVSNRFAARLSKRLGANSVASADDPSLPEAGTFVAQDGDVHKPSQGDADGVEDHVPFQQPTKDEMGGTGTDKAADNPSLPEAGTFVAPDGDAHKGRDSEGDKLEERVPFPKPSADEMGIKKPTES